MNLHNRFILRKEPEHSLQIWIIITKKKQKKINLFVAMIVDILTLLVVIILACITKHVKNLNGGNIFYERNRIIKIIKINKKKYKNSNNIG